MKDQIGDRMKRYELPTRYMLMRRGYTIIRVDGKAFHTYTKGLQRPFDEGLMVDMNQTMKYLCENIQGAKLGYVQSDEISILLTDFDTLETQAWFDGNIQKMASISASLATAKFNQLRFNRLGCESVKHDGYDWVPDLEKAKLAHFDSRVFQVPTRVEAANYFYWRYRDCVKNSISSVAQSLYSSKELHCKNQDDMKELIKQKGKDWDMFWDGYRFGRYCVRSVNTWAEEGSWITPHASELFNFGMWESLIPENK